MIFKKVPLHLLRFPFHLNSRRKERFLHSLAKETLALPSALMGPEVPVDLSVGKFHHRCARKIVKPPISCEHNKALRADGHFVCAQYLLTCACSVCTRGFPAILPDQQVERMALRHLQAECSVFTRTTQNLFLFSCAVFI